MSPESLFLVCNYGVLPFWALLVLAPAWSGTQRLVHSLLLPLVLGALYTASLAVGFGSAPADGGFGSLHGVQRLLSHPWGALAGWIHYLVFDLFVGAWEVRDARRRGLGLGPVRVCLVFTLMLGPIGLALYLLLRWAVRGVTSLAETAPAPAGGPGRA